MRELGWSWRHSSFSTGAEATCVDVALRRRHVLVRDSKDPDGARLRFTHQEWVVFLLGARAGEFDLPVGHDTPASTAASRARTSS